MPHSNESSVSIPNKMAARLTQKKGIKTEKGIYTYLLRFTYQVNARHKNGCWWTSTYIKTQQMKIKQIDKPKYQQKKEKNTECDLFIKSDLIDRSKQCRSANIKIDVPPNNKIWW